MDIGPPMNLDVGIADIHRANVEIGELECLDHESQQWSKFVDADRLDRDRIGFAGAGNSEHGIG